MQPDAFADVIERTLRLVRTAFAALLVLIMDFLTAGALYIMTHGALNMFYERKYIGADGLLGRFFRDIGWGTATFSQFFALVLTIVSISLAAVAIHWWSDGTQQSSDRVRHLFWPMLGATGVILVLDLGLFLFRLSAILFPEYQVEELPSWFHLVWENLDRWNAWLLLLGVLYPVVAIGSAMLTQYTWRNLWDSVSDWLDLLRGNAAPGQQTPQAVQASSAVGRVSATLRPTDQPITPSRAAADRSSQAVMSQHLPIDAEPASVTRPVAPPDAGGASPGPTGATPIGAILRDLQRARDGHAAGPTLPPPPLIQSPAVAAPAVEAPRPRRYRLCPKCRALVLGAHACPPDAAAQEPEREPKTATAR